MSKYDVILADPPWRYDTKFDHRDEHYPRMYLTEICSLPIENLAAKDCALFMWLTWPMLYQSHEVIKAWGFTYSTLAWVWVKANPSGFGFFTGMGSYTRSNSEPCVLCHRGQMPAVADHGIQSLIYSAVRQHSRKPDDQYRKIQALYPDKRYLELFARRTRPGWDAWGNEVPNSVELQP